MRPGPRVSILTGTLAAVLLGAGCAGAGSGPDTAPDPAAAVAALFDPSTLYRRMGFLASGAPLPFAGDIRFLATASPDTTLAVLALSLSNSALAFRLADQEFEARYAVEFALRQGGNVAVRLSSPERVRVASREETQRRDESIIFQKFLRVPPGTYEAVVTVRDEQADVSTQVAQAVHVPRRRRPGLSDAMAVYRGGTRTTLEMPPPVLMNPRSTVSFGLDSLWVYVEAYGLPDATPAHVDLLGPDGAMVRRDTVLSGDRTVATALVAFPPEDLTAGEWRLRVTADGVSDTAASPLVVSFSGEWAITDFDEILSLLRFFGHDSAIAEMRAAPSGERPALWRAFWRASDPVPATSPNEALELYFQRLQEANERFRETGGPGWTTDRGEVFITIGEPDEVFDSSSGLQGSVRIIRWNYLSRRLSLDFIDDTGFGRFRLTPASRVDYRRALSAIRSGS